jgi:hypothetical protein
MWPAKGFFKYPHTRVFQHDHSWFDMFFKYWKKFFVSVICKGFFSMTTPSFDKIFRIFLFWFLKRQILFIIEVGNYKLYNLWICYMGMAFRDGNNFCKAFTDMTYLTYMHLCLCKSFAKIVPIPKNYNSEIKNPNFHDQLQLFLQSL